MTTKREAPQREAVECPHCGEATLPNRLADGLVVCSCAAERPLPPLSLPRPGPLADAAGATK